MNKEKHDKQLCADIKDLSAFFDNELDPNSAEYVHISSCQKCAGQLEVYSLIEKSIQNRLDECVDEGLVSRIQSGVRQKLQTQKEMDEKTLPFINLIMRIAAILIFSAGIVLIALRFGKREQHNESLSEKRAVAKVNTSSQQNLLTKQSLSVSSGYNKKQIAARQTGKTNRNNAAMITRHSTPSFLPLEELTPVSINSSCNTEKFAANIGGADINKPVYIPTRVSHVWVTENINSLSKLLYEFSRENKISPKKIKVVKTKSFLNLHIRLSKEKLVKLIKLCALKGNELLSPAAPQPEQNRFYGKAETQVQYNAKFVSERP